METMVMSDFKIVKEIRDDNRIIELMFVSPSGKGTIEIIDRKKFSVRVSVGIFDDTPSFQMTADLAYTENRTLASYSWTPIIFNQQEFGPINETDRLVVLDILNRIIMEYQNND